MSRMVPTTSQAACCFPRVSGDEPALICSEVAACTFSPRERG